jgi:UPF0716 protein FxsA
MLLQLLLLAILIPVADVVLIGVLIRHLGLLRCILILGFLTLIGLRMAKQQWNTVVRNSIRAASGEFNVPQFWGEGALLFIAGLLFLVPGLLTDAFGFALLFPATRRLFRQRMGAWIQKRWNLQVYTGGSGPFSSSGPEQPTWDPETVEGRARPTQRRPSALDAPENSTHSRSTESGPSDNS